VGRRLECLPWWLLLVSISRCRCEVGALPHEARRSDVAENRGDSNMIQARSEW
jgi:hypothetical protein